MISANNTAVLSGPNITSVQAAAYQKATWRLIPLLAICFLAAYLDRANISFAQLQMQGDIGLSYAAYGIGASIFFIGYFLFEIPSNLILEKVGASKWIACIMVLWGVASALMMYVRDEKWFYILRFIIGAAEAGFMPGVILFFTYWFPARRRAKINALFLVSVPLSGVVGGPIAGFLMTHFHEVGGLPGWQWLFLVEGGLAVVLGMVVWFYLTDRPLHAKWLTEEERNIIVSDLASESSATHEHHFGKALRQPEVIFLAAVDFFALIGLWGLAFWLPTLIKQTGVTDVVTIGFLSAIPYVAGAVAMVILGRSSDRTGERKKHVGIALLVASVGYALSGLFSDNTSLSIAALTVAAIGTFGFLPAFWTLPAKIVAGPAAAGAIALINSVANLSGAVSPYLVGEVKQLTGSTEFAMFAIAGSVLIAALLVLLGFPKKLAERDSVNYSAV